jgi:hypothetical protein
MSTGHRPEGEPKRKWHYTTGECFWHIVQDGLIKPATARVPAGENPIVWFSTNPEWEPTANKSWVNPQGTLVGLDKDATAKLGGGLVRIGVANETAPHDWHAIKELSRMSSRMSRGLYAAAVACGARPGDWWGSLEPVPRSKWIAIQIYDEGAWVDWTGGSRSTV